MDNKTFPKDTVHVEFALSGTYINYGGAALASIFENTKHHIAVHIMTSDTREELTKEHKEKLTAFAESYGHEIYFYNVQELLPGLCAKFEKRKNSLNTEEYSSRFSRLDVGNFASIWCANILPKEIKKIVHLGADTIFCFDIAEMYNEDTGIDGIAAVPELEATFNNMLKKEICDTEVVPYDKYFCAGQMVIDLEKFRERPNILEDGLDLLIDNPRYDCVDQDILNYFYKDTYRRLSIKYGVFVDALRVVGKQEIKAWSYHYAGNAVDIWNMDDAYNRLFMKYFAKSPFFTADFFINAMQHLKLYFYASNNYSRDIFNGINGRKNVFVCNKASETFVRNHFTVKPEDAFCFTDDTANIVTPEGLENEMKKAENVGKCYVLFMLGYEQIKNYLAEKGFKEFQDFIDAMAMVQGIQNQLSYLSGRTDLFKIKP